MARATYRRPTKPRQRPNITPIPAGEGRVVDFRVSLGDTMVAVIDTLAEMEGISMSAFARQLIREGLSARGIDF